VAVGGFLLQALFSAYHKDASPVTLSPELQAAPKDVGYMDFYKPVELRFSFTHTTLQLSTTRLYRTLMDK
jgi:hypothetical protein